ncbi:MAG TPA: alpha/beta hydrolase [bacterium]
MLSRYLTCAGREIHFTEWGAPSDPPVIMWHGLARTGRDFDDIAGTLASTYRVICPDTLGRGLSAWAVKPAEEYNQPFYGKIALDLLAQLKIDKLRWVGTSMGGLLGISLAGGALKGRITHLVVNDIGPIVEPDAVKRIATYAGNPPVFDTLEALEQWFRTTYAPFGIKTDGGWRALMETSARRMDNGKVTVHYDPRIVQGMASAVAVSDPWAAYDQITCKTLLLRGKASDVISSVTAQAMTQRGPKARLVEFAGYGHAPPLIDMDQQRAVTDFLAERA